MDREFELFVWCVVHVLASWLQLIAQQLERPNPHSVGELGSYMALAKLVVSMSVAGGREWCDTELRSVTKSTSTSLSHRLDSYSISSTYRRKDM